MSLDAGRITPARGASVRAPSATVTDGELEGFEPDAAPRPYTKGSFGVRFTAASVPPATWCFSMLARGRLNGAQALSGAVRGLWRHAAACPAHGMCARPSRSLRGCLSLVGV